MTANKIEDHGASVEDLLSRSPRQDQARRLVQILKRVSGEPPLMWGASIIGFGSYRYRYDSGREGEMCRLGLSPRKANLTLYLPTGLSHHEALLASLGKHSTGKACLYLKSLADVDLDILAQLLAREWELSLRAHPESRG